MDISWVWDSDAEIAGTQVFREGGLAVDVPLVFPLSQSHLVNDPAAQPGEGPISYYIEVRDECDSIVRTPIGQTIFISGTPQPDRQNLVEWTPFSIPEGTVQQYDLFRIVGGSQQFLATVDGNITSYLDPVDIENPLESEVCYFVIARGGVTLPTGSCSHRRCPIQYWLCEAVCQYRHAKCICTRGHQPGISSGSDFWQYCHLQNANL